MDENHDMKDVHSKSFAENKSSTRFSRWYNPNKKSQDKKRMYICLTIN